MKTLVTTITILLMIVVSVSAAPIHVDFTSSNYAGAQATSTFTRHHAEIDRDVSWDALDEFLNPFGTLTYNNDSGGADGIGMIGRGNYSNDEIEANERARLRFNEAVHVVGVNLTDFFNEVEPNLGDCPLPGCYLETGAMMFYYGDGTHSLWQVLTAPIDNLRTGNGAMQIAVNQPNVVAIVFAALGIQGPQLHEFSIAGVTVQTPDIPEVPEPATLTLVGLGVLGLLRRRRHGV